MNFPGLDPIWSGTHHALHASGILPTWSLEISCAALSNEARVLVVATTALGDSILTTPLIDALSRSLGPERVSLLVKEPYADLFRGDPRLHHVFTVRGKYRWAQLRDELESDRHQIALLSNFTEPDLVPWLRWSGVRGFLRYRSRWIRYPAWIANQEMLRQPGAPDYATGHAIENNLAMAEALKLAPSSHQLDLPHLRTNSVPTERVVLIHPGASRPVKRWPMENWARLADRVIGRFDCAIHLTGDRSEAALAAAVQEKMERKDRVKSIAGQIPLLDLAKRQSSALAFLSGDTGPYHMAIAVGCPTSTLFAPTDRGSSTEACGPHQVDPVLHRALQTTRFGDSIETISLESMWSQTREVIEASLQKRAGGAS